MKKDDCIFCKIANGDIPVDAIYEDDLVKVIFDAGPASEGHVLIIPKSHADGIYDLTDEQAERIFAVAVKVSNALKKAFEPDGLNVVQNNGEIAGQTVFHFHTHLIPRYIDDGQNLNMKPSSPKEGELEEVLNLIVS